VRSEEDQDYSVKGTIKFHIRGNDSFHVTPELKKKVLDDLRVYLSGNGLHFTTLAKKDASFTFDNVPSGNYILEAASTIFDYPALKVDVGVKNKGKIRAKMLDDLAAPYPISMEPVGRLNYFEERTSGLAVMKNLLFSPMVIMTVVMLGMTAFMQNIDPNTLKEMQNQGNGDAPPRPEDPAALISDFLH
jgi:hypothetical protein